MTATSVRSEASRPLPSEIAAAVTNRGLKLIVNPTEQCNLRCVYCYESFSIGDMTDAVSTGVVNLVERRARAGLDWLEVEFFGGEPLAAWAVVDRLSARINAVASQHGIELLGSMTTNGTLLTADRLALLLERRFKGFQITVDGPQPVHDGRRVTRGRRGTFDAVMRALRLLKSSDQDHETIVRLHFDAMSRQNLLSENGVLADLIVEFALGDARFQFHFHPVEPFGRAARADSIAFFASRDEADRTVRELAEFCFRAGLDRAQAPQGTAVTPVGESGHALCYAARANSFLIRADGRVGKCTIALDDDKNTIGRIDLNGDLLIDHAKHVPWLRGLVSGDPGQLSCPAHGLVWNAG